MVDSINVDYLKQQQKDLPNFWDILEQNESLTNEFILSDKLWSFLQEHARKHRSKGNGFGYGLMTKNDITSRTLTARYYKDGSEVLIERLDNNNISLNPRKLSPRECARLMGFPEDFNIVVSKTQAYKQFGNSVVVPVIEMFAKNLINLLENK